MYILNKFQVNIFTFYVIVISFEEYTWMQIPTDLDPSKHVHQHTLIFTFGAGLSKEGF